MANELKEYIFKCMPHIDKILEENEIPIVDRFFAAARLFVETKVLHSTLGSNKNLLESDEYRERILPLFHEWYFIKYGDLIKGRGNEIYLGMIKVYGQPVEVKIPSITTKVVEEGKLASMTFPDHLQEFEEIYNLIQPKFYLSMMEENEIKDIRDQVARVVALTRSINLDIHMATNLSPPIFDMAQGVWSHFEKGISDILTLKNERASIACWEIHLAIEKSLKVLIYSKTKKSKHGHDLYELVDFLKNNGIEIDSSILSNTPSDKDAIKLRYAEMIKQPIDAFNYYMAALEFVGVVVSKLEHEFNFKNVSLTIKKAPWAR